MPDRNEVLERRFLNNLGRCWLSIKRAGREYLAKENIDLTIEQVMVLKILEQEEGLDLRSIAERADRERTTMTRMVDGLQRRNLVVRVPDKTDYRRKFLYLTHLGNQYLEKLESSVFEFLEVAYAGIDRGEIGKASQILQRLAENLDSM